MSPVLHFVVHEMTLGGTYAAMSPTVQVLLQDLKIGAPESYYASHDGQRNKQIKTCAVPVQAFVLHTTSFALISKVCSALSFVITKDDDTSC